MVVQIEEVMGRANQGITLPYKCRGDDGNVYFVKGVGAGRRSQVCEWIAGRLAVELGLPIAPFTVVDVPEQLMALDLAGELRDLGIGPAFGSRKLSVVELSVSHLAHVPASIRQDVIAFDWWIHNLDRTLGALGGNPNLFWDIESENLVVIDHNQAFDPMFSERDFLEFHAFRSDFYSIAGDWIRQQDLNNRFRKAMGNWNAICNAVPAEWWFLDAGQTDPINFDIGAVRQHLMRFEAENIWALP